MHASTLIDYAKSLDCIHCGLCLQSCPTYRLTGREPSSPRGRIHLMRAVAEGSIEPDEAFAEEMEFCLLCRGCESVCPSGVRFGAMMETTRAGLEERRARGPLGRFARWLGFRVLLPHRATLRATAGLARLAQRSGLLRLLAPLLGGRRALLLGAPTVPRASERRRLPDRTPARGERRGTVLVLEGCVMPELFGRVNRATVAALSAAGLEVRAPREQGCCGSLHAHNGDLEGARRLARLTIEVFEDADESLPIVVNSAGCSAHMKEYGQLFEGDAASTEDAAWKARAERLATRVLDLSELLARPEHAGALARELRPPALQGPVAYDDPCHLCHAQGIRSQPRALLDLVPGLERVPMDGSELCCGSAGIYSILRPADAAAVLAPKLDALQRSGARTLVTANPGCQIQWEAGVRRAGLDVRVVHLAEVLASALRTTADRSDA